MALREEGIKVILANNNPATVMTDDACADVVYFEPLTIESIEAIIKRKNQMAYLLRLEVKQG